MFIFDLLKDNPKYTVIRSIKEKNYVKHNKQLRYKKYTKDFMKKVESFNFEDGE